MDELITFITARLDDDERYARVLMAVGQRLKDNPSPAMAVIAEAGIDAMLDAPEMAAEAARWKCLVPNDLGRVLRDVAAKRTVVGWYAGSLDASDFFREEFGTGTHMATAAESYLNVMRGYAVAWSEHPDYRAEWSPPPSPGVEPDRT